MFVGRLTRRERIALAMHRLFRSRVRRYAVRALLIPVFFAVIPDATPSWWPLAGKIGYWVALYGLNFGLLWAIAIGVIHFVLRDQEQDTTLKLSPDAIILSNSNHTISVSPQRLAFVRLRLGVAGFQHGAPVFFLPYRAMSPEQRVEIETMYDVKG